jgi:hypothetical protein
MQGIYETNDKFIFENMKILSPISVLGGNYFMKFRINDEPLYIQPPKCKTKQGILKAGKRYYSDLLFTADNENLIRWMENLENYCQKYIFENKDKWFETELDLHDIENSFTSPLKVFKSGKYYLVRTNIPNALGKCSLKIYDESETQIDHESIHENTDIMTILEVQGIKCSARNFQIEIEVKQMLVLKPANLFDKCILLTKPNTSVSATTAIDTIVHSPVENDPIIELENNDIYLGKNDENEILDEMLENDNPGDQIKDDIVDPPLPVEYEQSLAELKNDTSDDNELREVELHLDELPTEEPIQLKERNDVYYKLYRDAREKAKHARDLALSAFLEAKRIKNTYMLEDIEDSESDLDEDNILESMK